MIQAKYKQLLRHIEHKQPLFQSLLQTHSISSSYFFLLLLLVFLEGGLEVGALVLILRGGGRGVLLYPNIRVINLGVERSCSKLELKMASMATLSTFKHEHCRL